MISGDRAAASVFVAVTPEDAFDVFTREIDMWWGHGPRFRIGGRSPGQLFFEPKADGRVFFTVKDRTNEMERVTAWEPPKRLELEWRNVNFAPGEKTFVEVTFTPLGDGTMVRVEHRGFSTLPTGHPARHGTEGAAFSRMMGMWWGELLTSLREHVVARRQT